MTISSQPVVWVTGASKGIGHAIVVELLKNQYRVAASSRSSDSLDSLIKEHPNQLACFPCDITQQEQVIKSAQDIVTHFGQINIVIANAGTCEYVDVKHFDSKLFERVLQTNFMGLIYTIEAALPYLRQAHTENTAQKALKPHIVCMSSSVAWLPLPRAEAYGASKAAVSHFLEALRADLYAEGIDVSGIYPGFVKTPLTDKNDFPMPNIITSEEAAEHIIRGIKKRHHTIHFPKKFTWTLKLIACLPSRLRLLITRKMSPNQGL